MRIEACWRMTLDLNSWETKFVLEAVRTLGANWSDIIEGSDDEDIQSEYGDDLAQLPLVQQRIEAAACKEFGTQVREFRGRLWAQRGSLRGSAGGAVFLGDIVFECTGPNSPNSHSIWTRGELVPGHSNTNSHAQLIRLLVAFPFRPADR